jgi:hypothetical protein
MANIQIPGLRDNAAGAGKGLRQEAESRGSSEAPLPGAAEAESQEARQDSGAG